MVMIVRVLTATNIQLLSRLRDLFERPHTATTISNRRRALAFHWGSDGKNPEEERLMSLIQQIQSYRV